MTKRITYEIWNIIKLHNNISFYTYVDKQHKRNNIKFTVIFFIIFYLNDNNNMDDNNNNNNEVIIFLKPNYNLFKLITYKLS